MLIIKRGLGIVLVYIFAFMLFMPKIGVDKAEAVVPTIADYWNGAAEWQLHSIRSINGYDAVAWHGSAGTSIRVIGNTWYNFQRYCEVINNVAHLGMQCFKSTDKGLTWSAPVKVLVPQPGTVYSLHLTDGDFWYDAANNKWRALVQSLELGTGKHWQGCYFERAGSDPMGLFTTPSGFTQPAVSPKEIWSQIADNQNDDCVKLAGGKTNQVFDEGTFEIVEYNSATGRYTIALHGALWNNGVVGSYLQGVRGTVTTANFQTYTPLANDCTFDKYDTDKWNVDWSSTSNGSIGAGAGCMLKEGSYWYAIVEGADRNLIGVDGQNWTMGLFRSTSLSNVNWENWVSNPIPDFKPNQMKIEWQYPRLFKDADGITYLAINKAYPEDETSFRIYKLVSKTANQISVDDKSNQITYSGTWSNWDKNARNYYGTEKFSGQTGSYAQFTFVGTDIKWVGAKESNSGIAKVYIDGFLQATVDTYSQNSLYQQVLFSKSGLTNTQHTIKVEVTGTKNVSSSGTNIVVDKFDYITTTPPNIVAIKSIANRKYVQAQDGGANPLKANASNVNTWEKFQRVNNGDGTVSFKSLANGLYVQAQDGGNGDLKACSNGIGGSWEKFTIVDAGGGVIGLKSMANNKFVQAQNGGNGNLKACSNAIGGSWEQFIIVPWDDK